MPIMETASLDLDAFHSLDKDKRQAYLVVVDQLRELGIGQNDFAPTADSLG